MMNSAQPSTTADAKPTGDTASDATARVADEFVYDAFFSYASDPDRHLVRAVEAFLEGLHANPLMESQHRRELEVCVDGSDFKKPRRMAQVDEGDEEADPVFSIITQYMARSRCLVVFVGPQSREHRWLTAELRWWLQHRGTHDLHFALSHGSDSDASAWMPKEALDAGFAHVIWFDFRGAGNASATNRIFDEERLRLAAALIGEDVAAGDLIKAWRARAAAERRERKLQGVGVTAVVIALVIGLAYAAHTALDKAEEAKVGIWTTLANAGATEDPDRRLDALAYGAAALNSGAPAEAYRALTESIQFLAQPLKSKLVDPGGHAIDTVVYLGEDKFLVAAGYDQTARLLRRSDLQALAQIRLEGRAVAITEVRDRALLLVLTRKGVDVLRYTLEPRPALTLVGRASVAPVQVDGMRNRGQTLAGAVDVANGVLFLSATSGRVEWYRLSEVRIDSWKPFHSVTLVDSQDLPLGPFGMAYVPESNRLIAADASGEIACLDAKTGTQVGKPFKHVSDIFAMSAHQSSGQVVAADARGGWLIIDPTSCTPKRTVEPPTPLGSVATTATGEIKGGPQVDAAHTSVAFSTDGALISVTGHDGTARVLAAATAAQVAIAPHTAMTRSSAISNNKRELVVSTASGALTFWKIDGGAERARLADIEDVAVSADGNRALTIGHGVLTEVDLATGSVLAILKGDDFRGVVHVAATPVPDQYLVWRDDSGYWFKASIRVSDGQRSIDVQRMDAGVDQRARVKSIRAMPDGGWLLAAHGEGKYVELIGKGEKLRFHRTLAADPSAAAVVGDAVVIADRSGMVTVVQPDGMQIGHMQFDPGAVTVAGGKNTFIAIGRSLGNQQLKVCDVRRSANAENASVAAAPPALDCRDINVSENVQRVSMSPDGNSAALAATGRDGRPDSGVVLLMNRRQGWHPKVLTGSGRVDALLFSSDGASLALGERRGLSLWSVQRQSPLLALPTPSPVRRLAFRDGKPDEPLLLSIDGLKPEILRIWDTTAAAFVRRACDRWPQGRPPPQQPGVPNLPPRDEVCGVPMSSAAGR